jgi:hypothetical protein
VGCSTKCVMPSLDNIDFQDTSSLVSWAEVVFAWAFTRGATITTKVFRDRQLDEWEKWLTRHVGLIIQIVSSTWSGEQKLGLTRL